MLHFGIVTLAHRDNCCTFVCGTARCKQIGKGNRRDNKDGNQPHQQNNVNNQSPPPREKECKPRPPAPNDFPPNCCGSQFIFLSATAEMIRPTMDGITRMPS